MSEPKRKSFFSEWDAVIKGGYTPTHAPADPQPPPTPTGVVDPRARRRSEQPMTKAEQGVLDAAEAWRAAQKAHHATLDAWGATGGVNGPDPQGNCCQGTRRAMQDAENKLFSAIKRWKR